MYFVVALNLFSRAARAIGRLASNTRGASGTPQRARYPLALLLGVATTFDPASHNCWGIGSRLSARRKTDDRFWGITGRLRQSKKKSASPRIIS
jgi:hypothetical protein